MSFCLYCQAGSSTKHTVLHKLQKKAFCWLMALLYPPAKCLGDCMNLFTSIISMYSSLTKQNHTVYSAATPHYAHHQTLPRKATKHTALVNAPFVPFLNKTQASPLNNVQKLLYIPSKNRHGQSCPGSQFKDNP